MLKEFELVYVFAGETLPANYRKSRYGAFGWDDAIKEAKERIQIFSEIKKCPAFLISVRIIL